MKDTTLTYILRLYYKCLPTQVFLEIDISGTSYIEAH